jgi:hypothetical protein
MLLGSINKGFNKFSEDAQTTPPVQSVDNYPQRPISPSRLKDAQTTPPVQSVDNYPQHPVSPSQLEDAPYERDSDRDTDISKGGYSIFSVITHGMSSRTSEGPSDVVLAAANDFVNLLREDDILSMVSRITL